MCSLSALAVGVDTPRGCSRNWRRWYTHSAFAHKITATLVLTPPVLHPRGLTLVPTPPPPGITHGRK